MTEPVATAPEPKKRGPSTPEGKARAKMNALKHGLRARAFGLLPEEDAGEWAVHLGEVRAGLGPVEPYEEKLATAVAVAMWLEIRADRVECDVMAEIAPLPHRSHGGDLQQPAHAASLGTAIRYRTGAGMATQRAQRAFHAHRKARKDGLVARVEGEPVGDGVADGFAAPALPAPMALCEDAAASGTGEPGPAETQTQFCTNELSAGTPEPDAPVPADAPALGRRAPGSGLGLDEASWLASLPVVEADAAREAKRRALLLQVEPTALRRAVGMGSLSAIECLLLPDMAAYEEWFARQPKPERVPASSLTAEHAAMVEAATRHNPPWIKGEYLSYWRPPVPRELCEQRGRPAPAARSPAAIDSAGTGGAAAPPATIATPLAALRARVDRLLDRSAARRPDELALAEAVCAVRWPHWGAYRGPIDLELLRRALAGRTIDGKTLTWLDSHPFAEQCRKGDG